MKAKELEKGGTLFSARPRQRACQDPLTRQGGDALRRDTHANPHVFTVSKSDINFISITHLEP